MAHAHHASTHKECLQKVCLICFNKCGKDNRCITDRQYNLISEFVFHGFDRDDWRLPTVICGTCRLVLGEYANGKFTRKLSVYDHSEVGRHQYHTRSRYTNCDCLVCTISKTNASVSSKNSRLTNIKPNPGRPSTQEKSSSSRPTSLKLCSLCLSDIGRGKPHNCSRSGALTNVKQLLNSAEKNKKLPEQVVHSYIQESHDDDFLLTSPKGGRPLKLSRGITDDFNARVSCQNITNIQSEMNLSNRQSLKLRHELRRASTKIEPNLEAHLYATDHCFDDYFTLKMIDFCVMEQDVVKGVELTPAVVCKDVRQLIDFILERRGIDRGDYYIKIYIDGGGSFLKICLSVSDKNYNGRYKDTGVKHIFLVVLSENVQENYPNILKLWVSANLNDLDFSNEKLTISCDLKLANCLLGLMSHGATFPCCWCTARKDSLHVSGQARSFQSIHDSFWSYHGKCQDKKMAKHYENVIHPSIIKCSDLGIDVIQVIPPPELHLLLGVVNTLFKYMSKIWPHSMAWSERLDIERKSYHGGSFSGNSCMKLLSNIDLLQSMCHCIVCHTSRPFDVFQR